MNNSIDNILFLTSFCCMACDGEIAKEEQEQLRIFAEKEHLFESLNIDDEFEKCLTVLQQIGNDFIKSFFDGIDHIEFSIEDKIQILDVAAKTIVADNRVEYSEIKFFKSLFKHLKIEKQDVLAAIDIIEDYWLEEDLTSDDSEFDYFDNAKFDNIVK